MNSLKNTFVATLTLKSPVKVKILKREWVTLSPENRTYIHYDWTKTTDYMRIDMIDNPCINQIRKILTKRKIKFKEFLLADSLIITTKDIT